jgi:hypothetical protein
MNIILSHIGSSPFAGYKAKGLKAEYLGLGEYAEGKAHKVSLEYPDYAITFVYLLDSESFLPVRVETRYSGTSAESEPTIAFENYKKVDGINIAHAWTEFYTARDNNEYGLRNVNEGQVRNILEKIEINPTIDDVRFRGRGVIPYKEWYEFW